MNEPDRYPTVYRDGHTWNKWGRTCFSEIVCSVCKTFQPVLTSRLVRNPNGTVRWVCGECGK